MSALTTYRLRAEYDIHVAALIKRLGRLFRPALGYRSYTIERHPLIVDGEEVMVPDLRVTIASELSLEQLRDVIRKIDDGHVMLETVQPLELYTGEREDVPSRPTLSVIAGGKA